MVEVEKHVKEFMQALTHVSITDWSPLESLLEKRTIKKNAHFFEHFDLCDDVAIISRGLFRIYLIDQEGEEKTFSFIPEKSFILDFFLSGNENDHHRAMISVQALEESEIYTIKYKDFLELMNNNRAYQEIYREVLLRNYIFKTKREIEFVQFNAKERLQKFMNNKRIDIARIPKAYLASYLGIQPPSLSRLFREIKNS